MRVYFDPTTRRVLFTYSSEVPEGAPDGDFVEVDGDLPGPITGLIVDENEVVVEDDITPRKSDAVGEINSTVQTIRRGFITGIVGQEMIYQAKEAEARDFVARDPLPTDLTPYPFIEAEVGVTATTAYEVAQLYLNLAGLWRGVGAALEGIRLRGVTDVEAATSPAEVASAMAEFRTAVGVYA